MRIKPLLISFMVGLFLLPMMSCSELGHEHGGDSHAHNHEPAVQQQPVPDSIIHDNIDSQ